MQLGHCLTEVSIRRDEKAAVSDLMNDNLAASSVPQNEHEHVFAGFIRFLRASYTRESF